MGNANTLPDENDEDPFDGIDTLGYRVLGVQPNSPASKAGLVSFLDFLVGANQKMLLGSGQDLQPGDEYDDVDLPALLAEYKGKEIEFLVWNIKSQQARLVKLTPDDTWGGAGLLGVTIRLDNYAGAEDRLVRVLSTEPKSPAAVAGLVAEKDFLLGTTHQTLESTQQLSAVLREYQDQIVELYVYNTDSDMVRVVALLPTNSWGGGGGLLGAEVGTGYLHRLPHSARETEGQSVERKVRYVRAAPKKTSSTGSVKSNGANDDDGLNSSSRRSEGSAVLELEPQLEMEPSDHDDDESAEEVPIVPKSAAASVDSQPAVGQRPEATEGETGPTTNTNGTSSKPPPPAHESSSATAAGNSAASYVFSQPPPRLYAPPSTTPATPSGLLPPPPQMHHYETPPSKVSTT